MKDNTKTNILFLFSIAFSIAMTIASVSIQAAEDKSTLVVNYAPGEVIQLIAPISNPDKQTERVRYYQNAIPLAKIFGFKNLGQLKINKTILGEFAPGVVVFGSWPSQSNMRRFAEQPEWPVLKKTRLAAWDELKLYNSVVEEPISLTFSADKTYTIAFAWTNPQRPQDYYQYLDGIRPLLAEVGGRFILKIKLPELESHNPNEVAPQQITFVEWDSAEGLRKLQALPRYKELYKLFTTGVTHFELHVATVSSK